MLSLSLAAALGACATSPPKAFSVSGEGDTILNRDVNGRSLSVVVRIYQLKDTNEFSKLTFDTLASGRAESELLGAALLDKTDVILVPGGRYTSSEKLLDDTRFVGIVAFFRRPDAHHWRLLVDASLVRSEGLAFRAQDCYVALAGMKSVPLPDQTPGVRPACATADQPVPRYGAAPGSPALTPPAAPRAEASPARPWPTPAIPEANVNVTTPVAPVNAKIGSGGIQPINVGTPASSSGYYGAPRQGMQ